MLLLDDLCEKHESLEVRLDELGTSVKTGLIRGNRHRDAAFLRGLPLMDGNLGWPAHELPTFEETHAE